MIDINIDAEKSVLSTIMSDNDVMSDINLEPTDFADQSARCVFESMVNLYNSGTIIESVSLADALSKRNKLGDVGMFLAELNRYIPSSANFRYHCGIVKDLALRRKFKRYAKDINLKAEDYEDINALVEDAQKKLLEITERKSDHSVVSIGDAARKYADVLVERNGKTDYGIMSKFQDLDNLTGGFKRGSLIILAARPAMGKTAFALNIAQNVARISPVLFVSLEMSEEQLTERLFKCEAGVMRLPTLGTDDILRRNTDYIARSLERLKLHIYDSSVVTVSDIRRAARKLKHQCSDLGLIIVDYIQLMRSDKKNDSRVQEVSDLTRSLKILARELDVPVIALSQLSRAVEGRNDKRPMLSDLRESGSIEQDADIVMMLYRDSYYNEESTNPNYTELIINKHRAGPVGKVDLFYKFEELRFRGLERQEQPRTLEEIEDGEDNDDELD